ncbi:MAG: hypothetical protein GW941_00490 [Candidatus Pacebacteria bacterium]|nr:hypothetical protein [Candidatus Paceibacterota bacterium]
MNHLESLANGVVTDFACQKTREAYKKLSEVNQADLSREVLLDLVKDMNSWIAFLDLADSYPRFRVVEEEGKQEKVEIYYP